MKTKLNKANESKPCCLKCGQEITGIVYRTVNHNPVCESCSYDMPHADATGAALFVATYSVMDDCRTGGTKGIWLTPLQKKEYEHGCELLAAMG